jgi:hypothetical protein
MTKASCTEAVFGRIQREDPLTNHSSDLFVLHYVELSALLRGVAMRPGKRRQLEQQLRKRYRAAMAARWEYSEIISPDKPAPNHTSLAHWLLNAADKRRPHEPGMLDVLVIDTVNQLPARDVPEFSAGLRRIWQTGVEVVLCAEDHTVFFNDMKDLVTTADFIPIYIKSMWMDHMHKEPYQVARQTIDSFKNRMAVA